MASFGSPFETEWKFTPMSSAQEKSQFESLEELERIEGNYYKVDLFVSSALVVFTVWVFFSEKNFGWTIFLALLAVLFLIRGIKNWKRKGAGARLEKVDNTTV